MACEISAKWIMTVTWTNPLRIPGSPVKVEESGAMKHTFLLRFHDQDPG